MKICVIGCGRHSALVHGPSCQKYAALYDDTTLAACCDLDLSRAQAYARSFGFERAYDNMEQMLEKEQPDAVSIIVPEHLIACTAIEVMKRGFAVQLEKPPGLCRSETEQLMETAEKSGVIHQVAFNRRFMPLLMKLRETIGQTPQNLFYEFYRVRRTEPSFETTAIHGIDAARYLIGSPYREVRFTYQELAQMGDRVVNILLDCQFENGTQAQLHFCPCTGAVLERMCVTAQDHTYFLSTPIWDGLDTPGEYMHVYQGQVIERISGLEVTDSQSLFETNGFYEENRSFFEHVRTGTPTGHEVKTALQPVIIADAIRKREKILIL